MSGNYSFFRMHRISDIYFVGGFGTVQWVDVADYVAAKPDQIVTSDTHHTLQVILAPYSHCLPSLVVPVSGSLRCSIIVYMLRAGGLWRRC